MNAFAITFLLINTIALLLLPRRWAPAPLIVGASYMTLGQGIEIGPFTFTVIRMLVAAGLVRVMIRGEGVSWRMNGLDWLMLVWAAWALISSFFHNDPSTALTFRLGLIYNACGIYFLLRIFCKAHDDVVRLCRIMAILLIPIAIEMLNEKLTMNNLFSALGGVPDSPAIRGGRVRSQGPFAHAILAGTIGAASLPLVISLWLQHRKEAVIGIGACSAMILASSSSGPIMSSMVALGALCMWRYRQNMRLLRWLAVIGYIVLDLVMKAPAYYLIFRVDITGGSTGWHRAFLIDSALDHLSEWWVAGTDYTRHWMPSGVPWSPDQADITNHYLRLGVIGGLPLMLLFIAVLVIGFSFVGKTLRQSTGLPPNSQFLVWALGASLFTHTATFMSVSYFDQSFVFFYLTLAVIGSVWSGTVRVRVGQQVPDRLVLTQSMSREQKK